MYENVQQNKFKKACKINYHSYYTYVYIIRLNLIKSFLFQILVSNSLRLF